MVDAIVDAVVSRPAAAALGSSTQVINAGALPLVTVKVAASRHVLRARGLWASVVAARPNDRLGTVAIYDLLDLVKHPKQHRGFTQLADAAPGYAAWTASKGSVYVHPRMFTGFAAANLRVTRSFVDQVAAVALDHEADHILQLRTSTLGRPASYRAMAAFEAIAYVRTKGRLALITPTNADETKGRAAVIASTQAAIDACKAVADQQMSEPDALAHMIAEDLLPPDAPADVAKLYPPGV